MGPNVAMRGMAGGAGSSTGAGAGMGSMGAGHAGSAGTGAGSALSGGGSGGAAGTSLDPRPGNAGGDKDLSKIRGSNLG